MVMAAVPSWTVTSPAVNAAMRLYGSPRAFEQSVADAAVVPADECDEVLHRLRRRCRR